MKLLLENWRKYLKEDALDIEAREFFSTADLLLSLNESQRSIVYEGLGDDAKAVWENIKKIARSTGLKMQEIVNVLRMKDGLLYKVLSAVQWNLGKLGEALSEAAELYDALQEAFVDAVQSIPGFKEAAAAGTLAADQIDEWLAQHPRLKEAGGFVVGALLVLIWLNMSFTGDWDYDFDNTTILNALSGNYDLSELFMSDDGQRMLLLLAAGTLLNLSFPWLKSFGRGPKLLVSLIYTLAKAQRS